MLEPTIYRASVEQIEQAFAMVTEYYEAARVVVREDRDAFRQQYFGESAGVWLAMCEGHHVGCVALRRLNGTPECAEIKRLYVRPEYRGKGIADLLMKELEKYARDYGYAWLYLDTAADMVAAARFYERNGFEHCERYNDNPQAAIFMRKRLCVGGGPSGSHGELWRKSRRYNEETRDWSCEAISGRGVLGGKVTGHRYK